MIDKPQLQRLLYHLAIKKKISKHIDPDYFTKEKINNFKLNIPLPSNVEKWIIKNSSIHNTTFTEMRNIFFMLYPQYLTELEMQQGEALNSTIPNLKDIPQRFQILKYERD